MCTELAATDLPLEILTSPLDSATPIFNGEDNLAIRRRSSFLAVQIKKSAVFLLPVYLTY